MKMLTKEEIRDIAKYFEKFTTSPAVMDVIKREGKLPWYIHIVQRHSYDVNTKWPSPAGTSEQSIESVQGVTKRIMRSGSRGGGARPEFKIKHNGKLRLMESEEIDSLRVFYKFYAKRDSKKIIQEIRDEKNVKKSKTDAEELEEFDLMDDFSSGEE